MKSFGLIGEQLGHSFSQGYFSRKFETLGLKDHNYQNYELSSIDELRPLVQKERLNGVNITIPYKTSVIPLLDDLSEEAHQVNAVNTIKVNWLNKTEFRLTGHNTDVFGFHQSIKPFFEGHHERALILGTGGASKAVAHVLQKLGVQLTYVSRNPKEGQLHYSNLNEYVIAFHPMIINTTPVGMYPQIEEKPAIPYQYLTDKHFLVDLIYNPEETLFLKEGKAKGAKTLNGLTMLHQQAEKAWEIWNQPLS